jgi:hypothetical protein
MPPRWAIDRRRSQVNAARHVLTSSNLMVEGRNDPMDPFLKPRRPKLVDDTNIPISELGAPTADASYYFNRPGEKIC